MKSQPSYRTQVVQDTIIIEFYEISKFLQDELGPELDRELGQPDLANCKHILVDCQHLKYANSLFLEILLNMAAQADQRQGRFALCCLSLFLSEVFEVTRLQGRWPTFDSREAALREIQAA
ncbi:MAG: STAS domain-containing protein [Planctomycetaceae bacterium]|nr:STAS domain-containing protein [Planctomycetaceae bacterium]